ncbi:MAG TPA: hypothetical protein PKB07_19805 [Flavilitoribacter sp.]|nr:hypothetical protein [Flavilitoribacter sp.]
MQVIILIMGLLLIALGFLTKAYPNLPLRIICWGFFEISNSSLSIGAKTEQ